MYEIMRLKTQWKKSLIQLNMKGMQNLKQGVFGFLCQCHRIVKSSFYSCLYNSFLLTGKIDFKNKYGPERFTVLLPNCIYSQSTKLLCICRYCNSWFTQAPFCLCTAGWDVQERWSEIPQAPLNLSFQGIAAINVTIINCLLLFPPRLSQFKSSFILNYAVHITFRDVTKFKLSRLLLVKVHKVLFLPSY